MVTDGSGNVVVTDSSANLVWVLAVRTGVFYGLPMTAGDIYIVAGEAVAVSPAGDLVIGDTFDFRVRAISG